MPELPEITVLARQMDKALKGRVFSGVEALQPKCLNLPPDEFARQLSGQEIQGAYAHGKWIVTRMTEGHLLINLGMGGEVLLLSGRRDLPEKVRVVLDLQDGACLALNFWWFGYCHYADDLADHPMLAKLGPHFIALTLDEFRGLLHGRRGGIKSFLLNQQRIAGIGNVYVQDPLFKAGLHPLRSIGSLSDDEIAALWFALRETLQESIDQRGSKWEQDLYGQHGAWDNSFFLVAYREGEPCPVCGSIVEKVKTGSTSSYICPQCQPADPPRA
jgi:formamidopyrimidine-DNA glycosylase